MGEDNGSSCCWCGREIQQDDMAAISMAINTRDEVIIQADMCSERCLKFVLDRGCDILERGCSPEDHFS